MNNYSIRNRLLTGMFLLLMVALIPPFYYFDSSLRTDILRDAKSRAVTYLNTVAWTTHENRFSNIHEFDAWLKDLSRYLNVRVTYIAEGQVVADTSVPYAKLTQLPSHADRPEVLTALEGKTGVEVRYSTTIHKDLIYAAQAKQAHGVIPAGILRVAIPASSASERLNRLEAGMIWVFIFTTFGTVLFGFLVTRPFLISIRRLASTAQSIGLGQYQRRIRTYPGTEFEPLVTAINDMAQNIEMHLRMVVDQKKRLEAVFDGMTEGVMVLDERGRIHSCNTALINMLNCLDGCEGRTVIEATMQPDLQQAVDDILGSPLPKNASLVLELPDSVYLAVNLVPFRDRQEARKMVLVFHDVSEREQLERVRRDFVANVSHELKTPLTSIKGYAETLIDAPDTPHSTAVKFLNTILRNADHMTKMVNSLLVLARSQHHKDSSQLAAIDGDAVVEQTVRDMMPAALEKNIVLQYNAEKKDVRVIADLDGLSEVLRNLIDNAIKYSPRDSTVSVGLHLRDGLASFSVRDEGSGIPVESQSRIFERFYRLENEESPVVKDGSAGLGLAICRRIIRSYGGDIWVESPIHSDTNTGAAFIFTLKKALQS
ncbi:ATP-binding protein [Halodesulfovibrio aestuarii]|uniref:histidine kinase n=1 Tax=Halodesulfovibrio aestuarii TaxID=126333 RepID=A0A8G2CC99_9BACT|nr:ATP-binding protein [Halodesulfovibrio aestuarii]SHJ75601.1 two-component system, OmpR family, phosphate regulon sensor histidine kinase PhoR [Halodesulfovibrio aestuarii]